MVVMSKIHSNLEKNYRRSQMILRVLELKCLCRCFLFVYPIIGEFPLVL